jgi:16S rRNA (guanine527-N7)-methyltransferase
MTTTPLYAELANTCQHLWQLELTPEHQTQLQRYYHVLMDWNQKINLTRIPNEAAFIQRHVLDSLTLWPLLAQVPSGSKVVDVGSGGGFPLIPLAIVRPDLQWHSMEATQKKVRCLQAMATDLHLNLTFFADRLEALNQTPAHQQQYQVVTARAVAPLKTLLPWVAPLLAAQGQLLAMKGTQALQELAEAKPLLKRLKLSHTGTNQWPDHPGLDQATVLIFTRV